MIIFVTGATAGFGACITEKFLEDGHKVIASGRRIEKLNVLHEKANHSLLALKMDVRNKHEVMNAVKNLPS